MNLKYLMKMLVDDRDRVKKYMPTNREIEVIKMCREGWVSSLVVAKELKVKGNTASTVLINAWKKGYLKREKSNSSSGGVTYLYFSII